MKYTIIALIAACLLSTPILYAKGQYPGPVHTTVSESTECQ